MNIWYKLVDKKPVPCDCTEAALLVGSDDRVVARTDIGDATISTVFLALDYNLSGDGGPILFETMVFGGQFGDYMQRYKTWEEAENGHHNVVGLVEHAYEYEEKPEVIEEKIVNIGFAAKTNRPLDI